jgi:hypothetical protein
MILPASAQILLHSSVLVWTAYYLMFKPFVILDSSIVVIFGQALQLVPPSLLLKLATNVISHGSRQLGSLIMVFRSLV